MEKILISIPNNLASKFKTLIPPRQRSKVVVHLIETEVKKREKALYDCALALEKDTVLKEEMSDWEITTGDGFDDGTR
jgi:hypothetical protein